MEANRSALTWLLAVQTMSTGNSRSDRRIAWKRSVSTLGTDGGARTCERLFGRDDDLCSFDQIRAMKKHLLSAVVTVSIALERCRFMLSSARKCRHTIAWQPVYKDHEHDSSYMPRERRASRDATYQTLDPQAFVREAGIEDIGL